MQLISWAQSIEPEGLKIRSQPCYVSLYNPGIQILSVKGILMNEGCVKINEMIKVTLLACGKKDNLGRPAWVDAGLPGSTSHGRG